MKSKNAETKKSIDLGDVSDKLAEGFPSIRGIYIFGSRAYGGGSLRSDIDILLEVDGYIRPADLRHFASGDHSILDLFLVEGRRATSVQNETYIEAEGPSDLFHLLRAKKFWDRDTGRLEIDIPWKQMFSPDASFIPTALPRPLKPIAHDDPGLDKITFTYFRRVLQATSLRTLVSIIVSIIGVLGTVFWLGHHLGPSFTEFIAEKKSGD